MAADGAGRGAGRIEQHGIERTGLPLRRVGDDGFGVRQAGQVLAQPLEAALGAIDRGDLGAGSASCAVLPPGAAQRSATGAAATSPRSRAGQRRGGVLHPPGALGDSPASCGTGPDR